MHVYMQKSRRILFTNTMYCSKLLIQQADCDAKQIVNIVKLTLNVSLFCYCMSTVTELCCPFLQEDHAQLRSAWTCVWIHARLQQPRSFYGTEATCLSCPLLSGFKKHLLSVCAALYQLGVFLRSYFHVLLANEPDISPASCSAAAGAVSQVLRCFPLGYELAEANALRIASLGSYYGA